MGLPGLHRALPGRLPPSTRRHLAITNPARQVVRAVHFLLQAAMKSLSVRRRCWAASVVAIEVSACLSEMRTAGVIFVTSKSE